MRGRGSAADPRVPECREQPLAGSRGRVRADQPPRERRGRERREHLHADEQEGVVRRARRRERRDVERLVDDVGELASGELGDQSEQGETGINASPCVAARASSDDNRRARAGDCAHRSVPSTRDESSRPLVPARRDRPAARHGPRGRRLLPGRRAHRLEGLREELECAKLRRPGRLREAGRAADPARADPPAGDAAVGADRLARRQRGRARRLRPRLGAEQRVGALARGAGAVRHRQLRSARRRIERARRLPDARRARPRDGARDDAADARRARGRGRGREALRPGLPAAERGAAARTSRPRRPRATSTACARRSATAS